MPRQQRQYDQEDERDNSATSSPREERTLPIQDAGLPVAQAPPDAVFVYHVHGGGHL